MIVLREMAVTMAISQKIVSFAPGLVGFRATATHLVNDFMFLTDLYVFVFFVEFWKSSEIVQCDVSDTNGRQN